MKKMNTLLSFLIAFSFVTVAFGQDGVDDALTRTTPVISHSGNNGSGKPQNNVQIKWGIVNVKGNSITLKLTKSIDCAVLQGITASTDGGVSLNISYNKSDLKKLQMGTQTPIVVKFLEDFADKKINIGLSWDLKGCGDNAVGAVDKTKQSQTKSMVASLAPDQPNNPSKSGNPTGGSYASSDNFYVILKPDGKSTPATSTGTGIAEKKADYTGARSTFPPSNVKKKGDK
jgi:hypothetical protein